MLAQAIHVVVIGIENRDREGERERERNIQILSPELIHDHFQHIHINYSSSQRIVCLDTTDGGNVLCLLMEGTAKTYCKKHRFK